MSFESGSLSFRILYLPRELPADVIKLFAKRAAPSLEALTDGEINGWVGWRHLLDRKITEHNALFGGYLRLTLMKAERKIPESLLRAECRIEELAHMEAKGADRVSASLRSEIRRSVVSRLQPQMPPTLKGIPLVYDPTSRQVYTGALSDKQLETFLIHFQQTVGFNAIPVNAETAAAHRRKVRVADWPSRSFTPELEDELAGGDAGQDFLTWVWFLAEARGGMVKLADLGDWAVMVEGPLLFVHEGGGAHEAVLRKGEPLVSAEAKAALLAGKKLRAAKLTLAHGNASWSCTFDASAFTFRSLRLPEPGEGVADGKERLDAVSRFQSRMLHLDLFQNAFLALYDRFVDERRDDAAWKQSQQDIHAWVKGRKVRR
jgi:hypothetical protein